MDASENKRARSSLLANIVVGLVVVLAAAMLIIRLVQWVGVKRDDIRYGRPRTMVVSAVVGHGDSDIKPTVLTAMNANRQVLVMELPGGNPDLAKVLKGPYLFGAGSELTPVVLRLVDGNGDTFTDLLVDVDREQVLYINEAGSFRLARDDESVAYAQRQTQP